MRRLAWWSALLTTAVLGVAAIAFVGSEGPTDCASEAGVRPKGPSRHCPATEPSGGSLDDRLDTVLEDARAAMGAPGIQAAIVLADGTTWTGAAGSSGSTPVRDDTLFAIGSITKPVVAALVLDLANEGTLGLDDPVARWLPRLHVARSITIRQLLSHTSGLAEPRQGRLIERDASRTWSPREVLAHMARPVCRPGRCWSYSNANYVVLGMVVEAATGRSVQAELETRFLAPLGLEHVYLQSDVDPDGPVARGFEYLNGELLEVSRGEDLAPSRSAASYVSSAGAIVATASDVSRFFDALFEGGLLPGRMLRRMTRPAATGLEGTVPCHEYGLGIDVATSETGELVWAHLGTMPGFRSELVHFPGSGVTIAVSTNLMGPGPGPSGAIGALLPALHDSGSMDGGRPGPCNVDVFAQRGHEPVVRVTTHRAVDAGTISASPDGARIVFGSARSGPPQIHEAHLATGRVERITRGLGPNRGASWSPDGETLAYADGSDGDDEIYVMDVASGETTRLTDNEVPDSVPAWSPDGREIAFGRGVWGARDVWVARVDGSGERQLTKGIDDEWWPSWSPDGRAIAFMNESDGAVDVVGSDRWGMRRLTTGRAPAGFPAWSRSGVIAFVADGDVWTARPDGSRRRRVTGTPYREFGPAWSPDGRTLFYSADRPRRRR